MEENEFITFIAPKTTNKIKATAPTAMSKAFLDSTKTSPFDQEIIINLAKIIYKFNFNVIFGATKTFIPVKNPITKSIALNATNKILNEHHNSLIGINEENDFITLLSTAVSNLDKKNKKYILEVCKNVGIECKDNHDPKGALMRHIHEILEKYTPSALEALSVFIGKYGGISKLYKLSNNIPVTPDSGEDVALSLGLSTLIKLITIYGASQYIEVRKLDPKKQDTLFLKTVVNKGGIAAKIHKSADVLKKDFKEYLDDNNVFKKMKDILDDFLLTKDKKIELLLDIDRQCDEKLKEFDNIKKDIKEQLAICANEKDAIDNPFELLQYILKTGQLKKISHINIVSEIVSKHDKEGLKKLLNRGRFLELAQPKAKPETNDGLAKKLHYAFRRKQKIIDTARLYHKYAADEEFKTLKNNIESLQTAIQTKTLSFKQIVHLNIQNGKLFNTISDSTKVFVAAHRETKHTPGNPRRPLYNRDAPRKPLYNDNYYANNILPLTQENELNASSGDWESNNDSSPQRFNKNNNASNHPKGFKDDLLKKNYHYRQDGKSNNQNTYITKCIQTKGGPKKTTYFY